MNWKSKILYHETETNRPTSPSTVGTQLKVIGNALDLTIIYLQG
jgi:hypothetical protein